MTFAAFLGEVVALLDCAKIPHMVTGSIASTVHGEPRMTQDLDLVIDPSPASLDRFVTSLDRERFYVDDASRAMRDRSQFNVIEPASGWKVDLIIKKDRQFSRVEFDRRVATRVAGVETFVATAEDVILSKLEWSRHAGSEQQMRDVESMLRVQGSSLDWTYLGEWSEALGVQDQLDAARERTSRSD